MPSGRLLVSIVLAVALPALARAAVCGDGVVEPPEQCDEGAANGTPGSDCESYCEEVIPALRIPGGGSRATDCQLEGVLGLVSLVLDRDGIPSHAQQCVDGDPGCDRDPARGSCSFAFWVCVGADDARIGCAAEHVAALEIRRPSARNGALAAVRAELFDKLGAYVPTGPGEICSGRMLLRVPVARRPARVRLRTRDAAGRADSDTFALRCAAAAD